ncbi:hypothetical protein T12_7597 [Trichinella patagoniensis]|uniref:Uncharacterized protein n=1 Tax=Trichinella patagoniensis TaxID=990121 RepID=A0A0V1A1X4_9BILA|nr:hypothetical protein T12_7597 [Trichinella patagoniensis]
MRSWRKTAPLGSFTSDEDQHPLTNISSCAYSGCKNTSLVPWLPVLMGKILAIVESHNKIVGGECTKISAIFDLVEPQWTASCAERSAAVQLEVWKMYMNVRHTSFYQSCSKSPIRVGRDRMKFRLAQQRRTDHTIDFMTVQQLSPLYQRLA